VTDFQAKEAERIARAMREQDYDATPPRCVDCLYFRRERRTVEREVRGRSGCVHLVRVPVRKRMGPAAMIERCTFGNFEVSARGVCDEWRDRNGERIVNPKDEPVEAAA
jgi:hypothetical protein